MTDKNKLMQQMINDGKESTDDVIQYVKCECQNEHLTPKTLGMLFEIHANVHDGFSRAVPITELEEIHPGFKTTNGCQWARSDNSYLGKRYCIVRTTSGGHVSSVKLDGLNTNSIKRYRGIRKDIVDDISKRPCAVLGTHSNIEVDHKNGQYNELSNLSVESQKLDDFQALSKPVNDAKRSHCQRCKNTGKRFDARILGFSNGWIFGDENTKVCQGCYWHDPCKFCSVISQGFQKED